MKDIITSDDILGKDVVDMDGEILGVAQQLQIDRKTKQIVGILVDQGFMKPDMFIGLNYIKNLGVDTIFLNASPRPKLKGLQVFDANGKNLGFVSEIVEDQGKLTSIIIRKSQFSKSYLIKSRYIRTIGFSVILRSADVPMLAVNTSDKGLKFLS